MSLDVATIQKEIESLRGERLAADERITLFSQRGRGRGRGRSFGGGRGYQNGRPYDKERSEPHDTGRDTAAEDDDPKRSGGLSASLQSRLGSRPSQGEQSDRKGDRPDRPDRPYFGSKDEHDHRVGRAAWKRRADNSYNRDEEPAMPSTAEPLPGSNKGRLASAVVTSASQPVDEAVRRPTESAPANPETKKRNKRLFGSLLGTLQKFQEEDQRFKRSRLAQNRAEAETRAAEKAIVDEQRMREKHRQDLAKARVEEINKKKELTLQLQAKEYEMLMVKRMAQEMNTRAWLRTAAGPSLLWLPKRHNDNTLLLLEQRTIDLEAWKDDQVLKMDKHKTEILERFRPVPQPLPKPSKYDSDPPTPQEVEKADEPMEVQEETTLEAVTDRYDGDDNMDVKEEDVEAGIELEGEEVAGEDEGEMDE